MQADKDKVTMLLKTARGQLDGILKMIEDDRYCIDIFNQILSTERILKKANKEVIRAHMNHCVMEAFEEGSQERKQEKINELFTILDKFDK